MPAKSPIPSSEFTLYKLTDPNSAWGYEYVAANETRAYYISFSSTHLSVEESNSELEEFLDTDYVNTRKKIHFPINDIRDIIVDCYSCEEFSLIAYRENGEIDKLIVVLGRFETYREHEFEFDSKEIADGRRKLLFENDSGEFDSALRIRDILTPLFDSVGPD